MAVEGGSGSEQDRLDYVNAATVPDPGRYIIEIFQNLPANSRSVELVTDPVLCETIRTAEREALEYGVILEAYTPEIQQKVANMLVEVKPTSRSGRGPARLDLPGAQPYTPASL
ncbi:MAG: hypothetical protein GDA49_08375 [Rhodospirillales bacterium]|nr:hypothetical protein [Rhodospirillales bacterium]